MAGLINGLGIETSSHKYGLFPSIVIEMEVVLANGDLLTVSHQHHTDLFYALFGSLGTIAVITQATLKTNFYSELCCSLPINLYKRLNAYIDALKRAIKEHDFVEGIIISPEQHVLITSNFCQSPEGYEIYKVMEAGNLWYYQHVSKMAQT